MRRSRLLAVLRMGEPVRLAGGTQETTYARARGRNRALRALLAEVLVTGGLLAAAWGIGSALWVPGYLANTMFGWLGLGMCAVLGAVAMRP